MVEQQHRNMTYCFSGHVSFFTVRPGLDEEATQVGKVGLL